MTDYKYMSDEALVDATYTLNRDLAAATKEGFRRMLERAPVEPPVVIEPPPVEKPDPPSMSASEIVAYLEGNAPTVASLDRDDFDRMPSFGDPDWVNAWTVRDGEAHLRKLWNGLGDGPDNTNAFLRVPGGGGTPYGYIDSLFFDQCRIEEACRWAMRLYGVRDGLRIWDTAFRNIRKEHGLYISVAGGGNADGTAAEVLNCAFENIAGQSLQFAQRCHIVDPEGKYLHETPNPEVDFTPGGLILVSGCRTANGAMPTGDRPGFDYTFFSSRNPVSMYGILIDDRVQSKSQGFLVCEGYEGTAETYKRTLELDTFAFRSARSAQESILLDGMSSVKLSNGVIDVPPGTQAKIRLRSCAEWSFENITSLNEPVRVEIDGVDAGTIDELSGAK